METDPERGDKLTTGQTVTLYISKGPELVKMPSVVGMDIDEAKSVLEYAGFIGDISIVEEYSDEEPEGTVLEQSIDKNEEVEITTKITLTVSKGPEPTEPPTEPPTEAPTDPPEVTKDVSINLKGLANEKECLVVIYRDGVEIYRQTVAAGTSAVSLPGQIGLGTVIYHIEVDDIEEWDEPISFA